MSDSLNLDLWRRAEVLFEAALDSPIDERELFLERACGPHHELKEAVESLLRHDAQSSTFLETPALTGLASSVDGMFRGAHEHDEAADSWLGRRLGAYRLVRPLGAGGMGSVFLAQRVDGEVEQEVAIKILHEGGGGAFLRSLRHERQILVRLDHPNIARALDGGTTEEGLPYVVLEYLDGLPITEYCDAGRLGVAERLELFRKVCDAVDYAHRHLIVHRDLKPSNILVTHDGEPKLLDFGIAKLLDSGGSDLAQHTGERTRTQDRFLTPAYASPEQAAGAPASTSSDLYSLGVLLYELLTGLRPWDLEKSRSTTGGTRTIAASAAAGFTRARERRTGADGGAGGATDDRTADGSDARESSGGHRCWLESPERRAELRGTSTAELHRQLKGDLDSIIGLCLRASPQERYRSVGDLEEDLRRHLFGWPVIAQNASWSYHLWKFVRRHRIGVALGLAAVIALVASGVQIVLTSQEVARERDLAQESRSEAEEVTHFLTEAIELGDPFYRPDFDLEPGVDVTVNEVLEYSAKKIRDRFTDRPTLKARLMHTIGTVYGSLSRPEEAEALHQEALGLRRERASERPLELVQSLNGLVYIYVESGRLEEAESLVTEAIELSRKSGSSKPGQIALAESLTNAGMLGFYQGELTTAETHLREALAIRQEVLEPDHQDQILNRAYLARVLTRRGSLDEAEALLLAALEICLSAEGEEHARYTSVVGELAWVLTTKGEHEAAERYYRKSLEILERKFGAEHFRTIEARGALALGQNEAGDLAAAEATLRANLELRRRVQPEDLTGQATALNNLGLVLLGLGRPADAEPYFRQGLENFDQIGESRDRHILLRNLGRALHGQGKAAAAELVFREALALIKKEQGEKSWRYGHGLTSLASVLISLARAEEALELVQEGEEVLTATLPAEHQRIALARGVHGEALTALGRFDEAETLLLESHDALQNSAEAQPRLFAEARRRLLRLYEAWGRDESALRFRDAGS